MAGIPKQVLSCTSVEDLTKSFILMGVGLLWFMGTGSGFGAIFVGPVSFLLLLAAATCDAFLLSVDAVFFSPSAAPEPRSLPPGSCDHLCGVQDNHRWMGYSFPGCHCRWFRLHLDVLLATCFVGINSFRGRNVTFSLLITSPST